jgi:hypothetical protein
MNTFTAWNRIRGITLATCCRSGRCMYLYLHAIILWCAVKPDTQPLRQIYIIGASGVFYISYLEEVLSSRTIVLKLVSFDMPTSRHRRNSLFHQKSE